MQNPFPAYRSPQAVPQASPLGLSLALQLPDGVTEILPKLVAVLAAQAEAIQQLQSAQAETNRLLAQVVAGQVAMKAGVADLARPRRRKILRGEDGRATGSTEEVV